MTTIKCDAIGLFVVAGGWICRRSHPSIFKEGDEVETHHFGGTTVAGVGKTKALKRGTYLEYWTTTGTIEAEMLDTPIKEQRETWEWYKRHEEHTAQEWEAVRKPLRQRNTARNRVTMITPDGSIRTLSMSDLAKLTDDDKED